MDFFYVAAATDFQCMQSEYELFFLYNNFLATGVLFLIGRKLH